MHCEYVRNRVDFVRCAIFEILDWYDVGLVILYL
jgi:hypothetical protein